jgi:hypothetical protein
MGQAKRRGTLEQRQAEGIRRQLGRDDAHKKSEAERLRLLEVDREARQAAQGRALTRPAQASTHSAFGRRHTPMRNVMVAAALVASISASTKRSADTDTGEDHA